MTALRQPGSTAPRRPTDTGLSSQQYICDGPCKRKLFVLGRRRRGPFWYCPECDDARKARKRAAAEIGKKLRDAPTIEEIEDDLT